MFRVNRWKEKCAICDMEKKPLRKLLNRKEMACNACAEHHEKSGRRLVFEDQVKKKIQ